ncbi:hypothetical protein [Bradyrhizobium icense]|nr:hypothetical protein [Bradyrhizobium icense]
MAGQALNQFDVLVLDAMGVLYAARDDVAELLVPFVRSKAGVVDAASIRAAYMQASLGVLTSREFWTAVQVDPALEDEYLASHRLSPGTGGPITIPTDVLSLE